MRSTASAVAGTDPDPAGQQERLGLGSGRREAALEDESVESDAAQAVGDLGQAWRWHEDGRRADRCQGLSHLPGEPVHVEADQVAQIGDRAMVDEVVRGQADDAHGDGPQRRIGQASRRDELRARRCRTRP